MTSLGQLGNGNAVTHGATSTAQIRPVARNHKRRLLRQIGLRHTDLESVGRALLTNWARAAAALSLMDEYAAVHGWLDGDGNPRGFARLYVSMLNAERLALGKLEAQLRVDAADPHAALQEWIAGHATDDDDDEDDGEAAA